MQYCFYVRTCFVLFQYCKQTCYCGQEGNTLNEGRGQDHVRANVVGSFRLTGDGFNGPFTDETDTDTGTDGGETGANRANTCKTRLYNISQQSDHHDSCVFIIKKFLYNHRIFVLAMITVTTFGGQRYENGCQGSENVCLYESD